MAWRAVASARSAVPSSAGHSLVHVPLPTGTTVGATARSKKPHDTKPTFGFLGFSKKTAGEQLKDRTKHEKIGISLQPPSTVSVRSNSNTQASTICPTSECSEDFRKIRRDSEYLAHFPIKTNFMRLATLRRFILVLHNSFLTHSDVRT
ncbi:hypothetical protein M413DRAFT_319388 [Hebeloma cylindrosporum]|uniref:Uncharacterized protein n=1 Tax=Hebeloma cylindrosporum TaxID=76867 RepID=A0A0C3BHQ9_HEBCY|nr:hypothetical protein M413DRAFT_319388 [Hebeloma cylindrosporum h7]